MKFSESLKKNKDFHYVYNNGTSYANRFLVMYVVENGLDTNRLGISVSKKVGNSVVRSRCKRLISENYRLKADQIKEGYDFVFVARTKMKDKKYHDVERAMENLFKKAGLYK